MFLGLTVKDSCWHQGLGLRSEGLVFDEAWVFSEGGLWILQET